LSAGDIAVEEKGKGNSKVSLPQGAQAACNERRFDAKINLENSGRLLSETVFALIAGRLLRSRQN